VNETISFIKLFRYVEEKEIPKIAKKTVVALL
jgi:hypothetical protein